MKTWLALAASLSISFAALADDGVVLVYRGANKWVAPGDARPLQVLLKAADAGQTTFDVRLPQAQHDVATGRLEVLRDLLSAKAKKGVVIEEVDGPVAAPNTIWVK